MAFSPAPFAVLMGTHVIRFFGHLGNGSCNGDWACSFAASVGGSSMGNNSCNGEGACDGAGSTGDDSRICNRSSNVAYICDANNGVIGNNQFN